MIVDEPSAIAYDCGSGRALAVGRAAEDLAGSKAAGVEVVHPLADGVIGDLDAATDLLSTFVRRACRAGPVRLDAAVCIPSGAGAARSARRRGRRAGARRARPLRCVVRGLGLVLGEHVDDRIAA